MEDTDVVTFVGDLTNARGDIGSHTRAHLHLVLLLHVVNLASVAYIKNAAARTDHTCDLRQVAALNRARDTCVATPHTPGSTEPCAEWPLFNYKYSSSRGRSHCAGVLIFVISNSPRVEKLQTRQVSATTSRASRLHPVLEKLFLAWNSLNLYGKVCQLECSGVSGQAEQGRRLVRCALLD